MPCADGWLSGESLLGLEDLVIVQWAEEEVDLRKVVDVGHGAGRVVGAGADVGVDAGAEAEAGGAASAVAAARCAAQCGLEHWGQPRPRAWDRWLDRADRVARTAIAPAGQDPTTVADPEAGIGCNVAGCQAQGSLTSGRPWSRTGRVAAGGRTVAVSIHLSVSTDNVRVLTRAMIHQECAGNQSYLDVKSAHSTTDRQRDGVDSVDCYASNRLSRLDVEYVERVDGERRRKIQLRPRAMTTHPDSALLSHRHFHNRHTNRNHLILQSHSGSFGPFVFSNLQYILNQS
jgi:hypothetical protein